MSNVIGTLRELNVKPGDVVQAMGGGAWMWEITNIDCEGNYFGNHPTPLCLSDTNQFRISSRADDSTKLWKDMSPEEKGALLLAHHEGKVIEQYHGPFGWQEPAGDGFDFQGGSAYRVKPEPVVEIVTLYGRNSCNAHYNTDLSSNDTHRITFDLIDGKPDCNSVKMEEI